MFPDMKKISLFLLIAACVGLCPVQAKSAHMATNVQVYLNTKDVNGTQRLTPLPNINVRDGGNLVIDSRPTKERETNKAFAGSYSSMKDNSTLWYKFDIPICVCGSYYSAEDNMKKGVAASVVPELTLKVVLLYSSRDLEKKAKKKAKEKDDKEGKSKYFVLVKELVYEDIVLERERSKMDSLNNEYGYVEMNVGVFIPQPQVALMLGDQDTDKKVNSSINIEGFAIMPTFRGKKISNKDITIRGVDFAKGSPKQVHSYLSSTGAKSLEPNWASEGEIAKYTQVPGVRLFCISETPYAPFYGTMAYPRTKPVFGKPEVTKSESETPAGLPSEAEVSGISTPDESSSGGSVSVTPDDTTTTEDDDTATSTGKSKKSSRKAKKEKPSRSNDDDFSIDD